MGTAWFWLAGGAALLAGGAAAGFAAGIREGRRRSLAGQARSKRSSYHLTMGLSSVIAGTPELAVRELRKVVEADTEAIEVYILLGDLYRERGRVEQAIRLHKAVLKRPGLEKDRKTSALASLSRDFAKAGFVDRAARTFREVSERDPQSLTALHYLERLHEETGAWEEALVCQQRILQLRPDGEASKVLGFLHWRVGEDLRAAGENRKAARAYARAVRIWRRTTPAHLALGDVYREQGEYGRAEEAWLAAAESDPERAFLAIQRLDRLWRDRGEGARTVVFCDARIEADPREWRLPLLLARRGLEDGDLPEAYGRLRQALERNPLSRQAQGLAWRLAVPQGAQTPEGLQEVRRLLEEADAFAEPQVCLRCRYRTTELLWRCPHCHTWDPFLAESG